MDEEINRIIEELAAALNASGNRAGDAIDELIAHLIRGGSLSGAQLQKLANAANAATGEVDHLKQAANSAKSALTGIGRLGNNLTAGAAKFSSLNEVIGHTANALGSLLSALGPVGNLFGGAVKATSAGLQFVVKEFEKSYDTFQNLSKVGATGADGIESVREQFMALGVPVTSLNRMIGQNAERLAGLRDTTSEAAKQLALAAGAAKKMPANLELSDMQLRVLGYTSEEIADTFAQYADLQRRFGQQQTLTTDQLIEGSMKYGRELDALAKLTGQSRDQLRRQLDQKLLDERFAATLRGMADHDRKRMEAAALAVENVFGPQLSKAVMAGATDMYTTQEAKDAAVAIPGFMRMVAQLKSGAIDLPTFLQQLQDGTKVAEQNFRGLAQATGSSTAVTRQYNEYVKGSTADAGALGEAYQKSVDQVNKAGESIVPPDLDVLEPNTQAISNAVKSMEQAGANISHLATSAGFATNMVSGMAEAVADITGWINNFLTTGSLTEAGSAEVSGRINETNRILTDIKKIQEQLRDNQSGAKPLDEKTVNSLTNRLAQLIEQAKQQKAGFDSNHALNDGWSIPSNIREIQSARNELNQFLKGIGEDDVSKYKTQTAPGFSFVPGKEPTTPTSTPRSEPPSMLDSGVTTPRTETPKMSDGGIVSGPRSGYQTILHGTEAVVPLSENRKIPVEITDTRDSGAALSMMERQIDKLNEMIAAIKENTRANEKALRTSYS